MKPQFHVTYEIVTPESAERGDCSERGFLLPGGGKRLADHVCGAEAGRLKDDCAMTLRDAISLIGYVEDSGWWFTECDGQINYSSGESELCSLHPPENITAASYGRLRRLLKARHLLD